MAEPTPININLMPQLSSMQAGNYFLIQTPIGTRLIDLQYLIIGFDNITFTPLLCSFSTNIDFLSSIIDTNTLNLSVLINTVSANEINDVTNLQAQINTLNSSVTAIDVDFLQSQIDQNVSNITNLSANEINDIANLQSQLDDLTDNFNDLFTLVSSNSALTLQSNSVGSHTPTQQWS